MLDSLSNRDILAKIIEEFDFYNRLLHVDNVNERLIKIEYFVNNSTDLNKFGMNIYALNNYFDEILNDKSEIKMKIAGEDDNSVKIMTIHTSKGLEFPYVYLPMLTSNFYKSPNKDPFGLTNNYGLTLPFYNDGIGSSFVTIAANINEMKETLSEKIESIADSCSSLESNITAIGTDHPELSSYTGEVVAKLNESVATQKELSESLLSNADDLRNASEDVQSAKEDIDSLIKDSKSSLSEVQSSYEDNLKDSLDKLSSSLSSTGTDVNGVLKKLDTGTDKIAATASTASGDLSDIKTALDTSCRLLNRSAKQIKKVTKKLTKIQQTGDFSDIKSLLTDNTEDISTFLSAPVSLNTTKLYPIENYGSSMAPFYSTLSIWVGGIVLVAMLKVSVSGASIEGLKKVKNYQMYLGRYIIFLIVGLLQSTLICLGDLFYLGIQCKHPVLFMLAGWFSSIVYVNIIYTLTVSFGDIGKAASVVLLVIQVAGSGGTFPIEVAPAFFKAVYPLLPFVHSMRAIRETIGGMYGMTYWTSLGKLGIFLVLSLILGLVFRKPIIKLNDAFMEKLEDTHLI